MKLLLVENLPDETEYLQNITNDCLHTDFSFHVSKRLADAVALLEKQHFDLVLLDLNLPGSTGIETLKRYMKVQADVPVVILAGQVDRQLGIDAVSLGAQDYLLKKSFNAEIFERVCRYAVERHALTCRLVNSEIFLRASINALTAHIAIINSSGTIIMVNDAWRKFAKKIGVADLESVCEGTNYFLAHEHSFRNNEHAETVMLGTKQILANEVSQFEFEYPYTIQEEKYWFHVRISPLKESTEPLVVVSHEEITTRKLAEESLQKNERTFRHIFEILPIGIWLTDEKGKLLNGNAEGKRIYGNPSIKDLNEQHNITSRFLPSGKKIQLEEQALQKTLKKGTSITNELLEIDALDGQTRTILNSTSPLTDSIGKIEGAVMAHLDVTALQEVEQALAESENRLRLVFEASPNCVYIKNSRGEYVMVNHSQASLYQSSPEAMIGKTDRDFIETGVLAEEYIQKIEKDDSKVINAGSSVFTEEEPFTTIDNETKWFSSSKLPISIRGDRNCILGIAVDISEHRRVKEKFRNAELQMRTIINALKSKVILIDHNMRVLWANKAALETEGVDVEEVYNDPCHTTFQQSETPCTDCPAVLALKTGKMASNKRVTPQGRTWMTYAAPIKDQHDNIVSAVEVADDITDHITLENQLRQAQKMESLGTLAGGIAHDFNNILAGLIGYAELAMLKIDKEQKTIKDYLGEIYNAGLRASDLVRQILTFSRRGDIELQPLDISLVTREALKLLRSTLPTTISLTTKISHNLSPILADPTHIHQVIMNLCTNASHSMEPNGGELQVELKEFTPKNAFYEKYPELSIGDYISLKISDNGCGISHDTLDLIFDPYFTTKDLGEGTGLGLSVVLGIVKDIGGEIKVDSILGEGTTFTLYFPVEKKKNTTSEDAQGDSIVGGQEHILIVDDEPVLLKVFRRVLTKFGYQVTDCNDPVTAVNIFRQDPTLFDMVISDVTMPKMTGVQLAKTVFEISPDTPVCLMSGFTNIITEEEALAMGCKAMLSKPLSRQVLLTTIRNLLDA